MRSLAHSRLLCVWLVPFGFFVSLSVNDNVLPGAAGSATSGEGGRKGREGLVKAAGRIFSDFKARVLAMLGKELRERGHHDFDAMDSKRMA